MLMYMMSYPFWSNFAIYLPFGTFPHPVPQKTQAVRLWITKQILLHLAHNYATQVSFAVLWSFVDMAGDHWVSPIVPPRKTW